MAVRNDFAAGEVLAAADLNDTFASKVDYALPVNAQTGTTYTFVAADAEKLTTASNASPVTLTIPPASSVAWPDNTVLRVVNYGAGDLTIAGGSGVTVTNATKTLAQYESAALVRTGSDAWTLIPFSGGAGNADFSDAATGTYTDSGVDYKYITYTASGTLTVTKAGLADVLVVGGGGGGGRLRGGGGGAGGHLYAEDVSIPAGTLQVRVGAGGAGGTTLIGSTGNFSGLEYIVAPGGGGGGGNTQTGLTGGSGGGGGGAYNATAGTGGTGFSPQGADGGAGLGTTNFRGGGGGGGSAAGATGAASGNGGAGVSNGITDPTSPVTRAGGGGGGSYGGTAGTGGTGGGGNGTNNATTAGSGSANTGGGGGGGGGNISAGNGGSGGSGLVVVRVRT